METHELFIFDWQRVSQPDISVDGQNSHFDLSVSRFFIAIQVKRFVCFAAIVSSIFVRIFVWVNCSFLYQYLPLFFVLFCFDFNFLIYGDRLLPQNSKVI